MRIISVLIALSIGTAAVCAENKINMIDYFQPMEPQGELVSEGIWGASGVLPRDIKNGIEDADMSDWCYWDGSIVKADDGKYHMYASRWSQTHNHTVGWKVESKGMHAVSDKAIGPYKDLGETWPHWKNGQGHNVIGVRMHDGRYAMVSSEINKGDIHVSDNPNGPWEHLGVIQIDYNGYKETLAHYSKGTRHMSNVQILPISDGRYMLTARQCAIMISENGIVGPYKIVSDKIFKGMPGIPRTHMEDPTIWFSGGMYHMVVNNHGIDTSYHFTSEDGISDWKSRGIAFKKDADVFRYPDGTVNQWGIVQRMTVFVDEGHPSHFLFSAIDVHKGKDNPNDSHGSKIILVPFDGESLDRDMRALVDQENKTADATSAPGPWTSMDIGDRDEKGNTGYDLLVKTIRLHTSGQGSTAKNDACRYHYQKVSGDVMLTAQVLSQELSPDMSAAIMLRKSLSTDSVQASAWITPGEGITRRVRKRAGALNETVSGPKAFAPYYLRLVKQGNQVTTFMSQSNRYNWEKVGSCTVDLGDEFYAGVAAASGAGKLGLVRFKDLDVHTLGTRNQMISHNLPTEVDASGKVTVKVAYETSEPRDLYLDMRKLETWKGMSSVVHEVNGYGVFEFEYAPKGGLDLGSAYQYMISLRPQPNDWKKAFNNHTPIVECVK